ncbi:response regulator transcription factor [Segetibacter koreensis]|uniref:response regulator transcription factor n=1 Tax=Segetibacter koreensis TaxID=398037 RepID=UPI000370D261|nr:LuxR C-terminal-related transcriptional regulator [Segetibacter koreensis]
MKNQFHIIPAAGNGKKNCTIKSGKSERITEFSYSKRNISITKTNNPKTNGFNLTIKEIAILDSLAKGNSYKMIANDCNIAINTVREHIRNIYHKLNVHSCIQAVLLALKEKLLSTLFCINVFSHDNAIDMLSSAQYLYFNF